MSAALSTPVPESPRLLESAVVGAAARKVKCLEEVPEFGDRLRAEGKRIVHCHGCFDIVHPGHLRYLQFAKDQGDILVVSLTSDDAIEKEDGTRPHVPQELRAETLAALEIVDYVVVCTHPTAQPIIAALAPTIYVKGKEYEHSTHAGFLAERSLVESLGGHVVFSSGEVVFSSTSLLRLTRDALVADGLSESMRLRVSCQRWGLDLSEAIMLLSRMRGKRVIVVGDAIEDRYVFCHAKDVAAEAPVLSVTPLEEREYLGGAAIIASHLRGLGAEPHLITTVAEDVASERLQSQLAAQGIATTALVAHRTLPQKTRYLVDDQKILKVDVGVPRPADTERQRRVVGHIADLAGWADAIIFADFGFGTLTSSLVTEALRVVRDRIGTIAGDVSGPHRTLLAYAGAHLLTPTEKEIRGVSGDFESSLPVVALRVMQKLGTERLIVKMGSRGCVLFTPREAERKDWFTTRLRSDYLPALTTRVVDPMGAGDALLAAATLAQCSGASLPVCGYLGSAAAAMEVASLGNVKVSAGALSRWLSERPELR